MIELIGTALTFTLSFSALMEIAKTGFQGKNGNHFQFWVNVVFATFNLLLFFSVFKVWWQL